MLVESEVLLSPSDIATLLGVHVTSPIRWMSRGVRMSDGMRLRLQSIKLPGSYRVRRQWLDEFLEALASDRASGNDASTPPARGPARAHRDLVRSQLVQAGF